MGRLLANTAIVFFVAHLSIAPASSATLGTWDPTNTGIGGQFGTVTATPPETSGCCNGIFIPFNVGSVVSFNGRPVSEDTYLSEFANSSARAQATIDEFSIGVLTFNDRNSTNSVFGPLAAGAAATTNYFVAPDLDLDEGGGIGSSKIPAFINVSGSFPSVNLGGNFVFVEVQVNGMVERSLTIANDSRGTQTFVQSYNPDGSFGDTVSFDSWPGTLPLGFGIPISPSVGTVHVRMFGESQPEDLGVPNALDFLATATLSIDTPDGRFVGLATGQAFVGDTVVPLPPGLLLFSFGLASIGLASRRKRAG